MGGILKWVQGFHFGLGLSELDPDRIHNTSDIHGVDKTISILLLIKVLLLKRQGNRRGGRDLIEDFKHLGQIILKIPGGA